jgi:hypothetical protein
MGRKRIITDEIREQIIDARRSGRTQTDIAKEFGITQRSVSNVCIDANMRTYPYLDRAERKPASRKCPKCGRSEFPLEYTFCPFCSTDMRSERELVIASLEDVLKKPTYYSIQTARDAITDAIEYLKSIK